MLRHAHSHSERFSDAKNGLKIKKQLSRQPLSHDIGKLEIGWHKHDQSKYFPAQSGCDLNMLGLAMLKGVGRHVDGPDIVTNRRR